MPDRIRGRLIGIGLIGGGTGLLSLAIIVAVGSIVAIVTALLIAVIARMG